MVLREVLHEVEGVGPSNRSGWRVADTMFFVLDNSPESKYRVWRGRWPKWEAGAEVDSLSEALDAVDLLMEGR